MFFEENQTKSLLQPHIKMTQPHDQTHRGTVITWPDGVPKACGGPVRVLNLLVCKHFDGGGTAGREGRTNVLPWYRLVGVARTSS